MRRSGDVMVRRSGDVMVTNGDRVYIFKGDVLLDMSRGKYVDYIHVGSEKITQSITVVSEIGQCVFNDIKHALRRSFVLKEDVLIDTEEIIQKILDEYMELFPGKYRVYDDTWYDNEVYFAYKEGDGANNRAKLEDIEIEDSLLFTLTEIQSDSLLKQMKREMFYE